MQINYYLYNTTSTQKVAPVITEKNVQNGVTAKIRKVLQQFFRTIFFTVATIPLKVTAKIVQLFGEKGKNLSQKILHTAKKIHALHILHPILKNQYASRIILSPMMNVGSKKSIRKNEDLQAHQTLLNLIKKPENLAKLHRDLETLSPAQIFALKNFSPEGAKTNGICFGASICIIRRLLSQNIGSENELIKALKPLRKGFPGIASGLTSLQRNIKEIFGLKFKEQINDQVNKTSKELFNSIKDKKSFTIPESYIKWVLASLSTIDGSALTIIPFLFKLRFVRNDWYQLSIQPDQDKFNQLDNGYYLIRLDNEKSGHAIVYIKKEFGSYLADPNFGLIKLTNPAQEIYEWAKNYGIAEKKLGIYSYILR